MNKEVNKPTMTVKQQQPLLPLAVLPTLLLAATNAHAFKISNLLNGIIVDEIMTSRLLTNLEHELIHHQIVDAVIITVTAWLVAGVVSLFCFIFLFDDGMI